MNITDAPRRWLRTREAAAHVGLSASTLEKLRVSGGGPRFTKAGPRIVVYAVADLDTWLSERARGSTSEPLPHGAPFAGEAAR